MSVLCDRPIKVCAAVGKLPTVKHHDSHCENRLITVPPKCNLTLDSRFSRESRIEDRGSRIESRYSTRFSIRDSRKNWRHGTFPIMQTQCRLRENDLFLYFLIIYTVCSFVGST